ncbi:hypothetical protein QEJ31_01310 [Pigmentibacter sp. JX0631]|uniref:hypothetical protein n=1 Tax=Pigmentibacter sp. JX0631 TaxID=2976982 RepID=UPI0024688049|nr:hypothetical protein [Pigmentibacter sp. JX0631]WGL60242.1 hypothetical protein QEJ31_01310 [Pigmentibacter sp. JX0631]
MKIDELKELQNFFLKVIYSNLDENYKNFTTEKEYTYFLPETFHRIQAYRQSFYGRVSGVFSQTIFDLASALFGKSFIENYLIDYFHKNPTPLNMTNSVKEFSSYLKAQEEIQNCPFVPDFISFCFIIHEILSAKNPLENTFSQNAPNAENIYLQKEHFLFTSEWPILQLYNAAKDILNESENKENTPEFLAKFREDKLTQIENKSEDVILFKSNAWSLDVILIPKEFFPIINLLSQGLNLQQAVENSEISEENFDLNKFSDWISVLTRQNAFFNKNSF